MIDKKPQGAMYCMVGLDINKFDEHIMNDVDFTNLLLKEENLIDDEYMTEFLKDGFICVKLWESFQAWASFEGSIADNE